MAENTIPKRSEVPEKYTWNLQDMFESDEAWYKENEALKEMPGRIASFQGKLGESEETLLSFFRLEDEVELRLSPLYGYASCKNDQDQGNDSSHNISVHVFHNKCLLEKWINLKLFPVCDCIVGLLTRKVKRQNITINISITYS